MDDSMLALIGVILQVPELVFAIGGFVFGAVSLVLQLLPKDSPRSSQEDEPGQH